MMLAITASQVTTAAIVIGLLAFIVFIFIRLKDVEDGNRLAKDIIGKVKSWHIFFIELLIVAFYIAEALIAASLSGAKITEVDSAFFTRLLMHLGISMAGAVVGVGMFSQVKDVIDSFAYASAYLETANKQGIPITAKIRLLLTLNIVRQVMEVLGVFMITFGATIFTLYMIGAGADQRELFISPYTPIYDTSQWFQVGSYSIFPYGFFHLLAQGSYLVLTSTIMTMFHLAAITYLAIVSFDDVLKEYLEDNNQMTVHINAPAPAAPPTPAPQPTTQPVPIPASNPSTKPRPQISFDNVIAYWTKHTRVKRDELEGFINDIPSKTSARKATLTANFYRATALEDEIKKLQTSGGSTTGLIKELGDIHEQTENFILND